MNREYNDAYKLFTFLVFTFILSGGVAFVLFCLCQNKFVNFVFTHNSIQCNWILYVAILGTICRIIISSFLLYLLINNNWECFARALVKIHLAKCYKMIHFRHLSISKLILFPLDEREKKIVFIYLFNEEYMLNLMNVNTHRCFVLFM